MGDISSMSRGRLLSKSDAAHYHAKLRLSDKGHAMVEPAKQSGPTLLSKISLSFCHSVIQKTTLTLFWSTLSILIVVTIQHK